jgi:magnesium transporter
MIRVQFYHNDLPQELALEPQTLKVALEDSQTLLWVDFEGEPPEACEPILHEGFGFHPLAIDDALQETHVPKLDDWEQYLYVALQAIHYDHQEVALETVELDVFLGENYLVSHHDFPIPALERTWSTCSKDERHRRWGADHLLYVLTDALIDDYMNTVDEVDEEIELIEDALFERPTTDLVQRIFSLKRVTLQLRRSLSPLREVLNKLARDRYDQIDSRDQVYFRDVYDHIVRLHDITESLRDLASGVLDTYLSVINNRMNDIMKTLTVITTLFMPLSFLTGFFGMNFFAADPPNSTWVSSLALVFVLLVMILTPVVMFIWIRRRGWM